LKPDHEYFSTSCLDVFENRLFDKMKVAEMKALKKEEL
jgi:hypothetical protein